MNDHICGECDRWLSSMRRCSLGSPVILNDDSDACLQFKEREMPRIFRVEFKNSINHVIFGGVLAGSKRQAASKVWDKVQVDFTHSLEDPVQSNITEVLR